MWVQGSVRLFRLNNDFAMNALVIMKSYPGMQKGQNKVSLIDNAWKQRYKETWHLILARTCVCGKETLHLEETKNLWNVMILYHKHFENLQAWVPHMLKVSHTS